jgi:hypothetical protein
MSFTVNWTKLFRLCAALTFVSVPLHSTLLNPGDTGLIPDAFPDPGNVPLLDSVTGTFSFNNGAGTLSGMYEELVAVDPFGITCTGCLDFAVKVSVGPGQDPFVGAVSLGFFNGYTTDVGYVEGTAVASGGGSGNPLRVSRGAGGGGVTFRFAFPGTPTPIGAGGSSAFLVVATNATTYDRNGWMVINGGAASSSAGGELTDLLEPTQIAPEPSTELPLSIGLAAFVGFGRFRGSLLRRIPK